MSERFFAINSDHWNFILVTSQQIGIAFNVDFIERIFDTALGRLDGFFSFIAKMTTGTAVNDDVVFGWSRLHN